MVYDLLSSSKNIVNISLFMHDLNVTRGLNCRSDMVDTAVTVPTGSTLCVARRSAERGGWATMWDRLWKPFTLSLSLCCRGKAEDASHAVYFGVRLSNMFAKALHKERLLLDLHLQSAFLWKPRGDPFLNRPDSLKHWTRVFLELKWLTCTDH